jgi:hypothetical protein
VQFERRTEASAQARLLRPDDHAGAMLGPQISSTNQMTPWLGLQLEGLHYAKTGVIEQD